MCYMHKISYCVLLSFAGGSDFSVPGDLVFTFDPLANESCREPIDITLDQRFEDFETFTIAIVGDSHEDVTTGMPNMITITITNADGMFPL